MKIEKQSISNRVLEYLRKQIILGQYQKGDHLVEAALSKELGVSRGPIREAIAKLEAENLVEKHSNGRTVVKRFDIIDIQNLYDSRILLETHALTQIDPEVLKKNKDVFYLFVGQMNKSYHLKQRDIESDLAFHSYLVKLTDNNTLIQLWTSLKEVFRTLIDITSEVTESKQQEIIDQHMRIVEGLIAGDLEDAQKRLREHLQDACHYCCEGKKLNMGRDEYV
ncbi:GntR family transcriptional regulator [Thalassobacillus pellis]|uniref:GntR family transcriptional regulator n=1 Tax=Thalassobacillus pellis TaxID=748008 RepID=UPI001962108F|nr:GntR family transcriptional regulator [Thalassobacillus pellis]MBM7553285.1 DNA-binding GntR family transcriptional regulator [Thalassobacillus pellis]